MGLNDPYWDFSAYADKPRLFSTSRGHACMRLDDFARNTVVFLGGRRADGEFIPYGTAFFVVWPLNLTIAQADQTDGFAYLVTAKHVLDAIKASGFMPVARINQKNDVAVIGRLDLSSWVSHPTMPEVDIAVTPIGVSDQTFDFHAVNMQHTILTDEYITANNVGCGDEVAVAGLLTRHFGRSRNTPIVRMGNIAAMPTEPVDLGPAWGPQEVYLIESRSIGGLSGSPVFLNTPPSRVIAGKIQSTSGHFTEYLLGVNIGLFETLAHADRLPSEPLDKREAFLETMSAGISVVVPVKRITEILESMEPARQDILKERQGESGFVPTSGGPLGPSTSGAKPMEVLAAPDDDNPSAKEDFMSLLSAAARSSKPAS